MMKRKFDLKKLFDNRNYMSGIRYLVIALLIIAITAGLNVLVSKLPAAFMFSDITVSRVRALEDETVKKLTSLDKDVQICLVSANGRENKNTVKTLELYDKASDHISWEQLDTLTEYRTIEKYTDGDSVDNNGIIVISGNRYKLIQYSDYVMNSSFRLEAFLNSAIDYVTGKDLIAVYQLDSPNATMIGDTTAKNMLLDGFSVKTLDLESERKVPDDCACLILNGIISDLSDAETSAVIGYIRKGGKVFLATDYIEGSHRNLSKITAEFGAEFGKGVVAESNGERFALDNAVNVIPNIYADRDEMITHGVEEVLIHMAMPIETKDESGVESQVILETTETSFYSYKNPLTGKVESGMGPFVIGAAFEKNTGSEKAQMVWISTAYIAHEGVNSYTDGSNITLFMNSVCWMGNDEPKASVYGGTSASRFIDIGSGSLKLWKIILMFVVPAVVIAIGAAVIIRRRRR